MDMWDWKAGNWQGITDNEDRALARAESHLQPGITAHVVKVNARRGHSRTLGSGWTGTLTDRGEVNWHFSYDMWTTDKARY
jgi:hypothetical protein